MDPDWETLVFKSSPLIPPSLLSSKILLQRATMGSSFVRAILYTPVPSSKRLAYSKDPLSGGLVSKQLGFFFGLPAFRLKNLVYASRILSSISFLNIKKWKILFRNLPFNIHSWLWRLSAARWCCRRFFRVVFY